jgi:hypothetical protein
LSRIREMRPGGVILNGVVRVGFIGNVTCGDFLRKRREIF